MIFLATIPSGPSGVRRVRISVPLVEGLLDGTKYFREGDLPAPEGQDLRPLNRPRLDKVIGDKPARPPRSPA